MNEPDSFHAREEMLHFKLLMFLFNNVILLHVLISPPLSVSGQKTYQNISLGTTLTTSGTTNSWLSPSGDFAFGFLPLPTNASLFLLAIWFAKTGNNTLVWHANGDSPVSDGSKLQLQTNGVLILTDDHGVSIWNTSPSGDASYAALLDTGNLILATRDSSIKWQSFDYPKDTLLPTQTLQMNNQLRSQLYDHDFSGGRFKFIMQGDGNLVMYPIALPTVSTYKAYWASSTVGLGNQLIFNGSGELYLEFTNKTLVNITTSKLSTTDFYQRVKLDPDGVLRHYVYPKDKTRRSSSWSDGWTVVDYMPSDICGSFVDYKGAGACGFNSYCVVNKDGRRSCECPPQYSFLNPDDPFQGCKPDFLLPSCTPAATGEQQQQQQGGFLIIEMAKTDWPFCDYENYPSFSEDQCRDNCLKDCFCSAAIFSSLGCFKKRFPLSNGRSGSDSYGKTLLKVGSTTINSTTSISQGPANLHDDKKNDDRKVWIISGALSLAVSLIILSGSIVTLARNKRGNRLLHQESNNNLKRFTYKQLDEATNCFAKELGRGAFGIVYEGVLQSRTVAVKRLINGSSPEIEKEFVAELQSIGQTHHKNLVCLFGYCDDGVNHLLVYEFMSNGSLTGFLFGGVRKPAWNKRVEIAIGIARGLLYLHEECASSIIHCDIKPQNILLDDDLTARISDFGLAKLLKSDQTRTMTGIRGTRGYVAPEWFKNNMAITTKVDVYSFGVILLELICCRKNVESHDVMGCEDDQGVLVYWAYDCYRDGKVEVLIRDDEEAMADFELVLSLLMLGIWCVQEDPSRRPTIRRVNQVLDGVVAVAAPPDPSNEYSKSK